MEPSHAAALLWVLTRELLLLAGCGVLIFGLDELFVDLVYIVGRVRRSLTVYRRHERWTARHVPRSERPGRFAVFIPAWDEADVIGPMLRRLTSTLDYGNYDVFVGVYPNDRETCSAAAAVRSPRIHIVNTSRPGPTTKADCLNHLWHALERAEAAQGFRYKAVVLHDAEDVVHPAELAVFDYMIPRKALVQLPVVPFADAESRWIAGHYLDEFAEQHGKNMLVREALGAALPSAGVACAFERGALQRVAERRGGTPFDDDALTEDYELGITLSRLGGGAFVRLHRERGEDAVATREHFPADFRSALKQKTRWLVGIAFQGWDRLGWEGSLADKYMLLRDRKPMANALLILIASAALLLGSACQLLRAAMPQAAQLPPLAPPGSMLAPLLAVTTGLLVWRLAVRAWFTGTHHGPGEALMSVPRALVANAIAVAAAWCGLRLWLRLVLRGERLKWEKTRHRFPSEEELCAR